MADEFDLDFEEPISPKPASPKSETLGDESAIPRKPCPMCGEMIAQVARKCRFCGEVLKRSSEDGEVASSNETVNWIIPYRNGYALAAYYTGLFSLLPCFPIGIAAFVLGVLGVMKVRRNPEVHGTVHAWIGIVMGFVFGGLWTVATVVGMIAAVAENQH